IISPLWHLDQKNYLQELLESKFKFIVTSVTSAGLYQTWLGKEITKDDVEQLGKLSIKYGFNLAFEGGEAETFVVDCPLFYSPIKIVKANKIWDGYRGRFEITEAVLEK
ncbi:MAG: diphthine--ammonia ligase, partial [Nitrosotalea sp.]